MIARKNLSFFTLGLTGALLVLTTACSSKPTPVVVATSTGDGSNTQSNTTTTGSFGSTGTFGTTGTSGTTGSSTSPNPFDTSVTTGTTGSSANIFDTTLNGDQRPNTTITYVPTPTNTQLNCLSQDSGFGFNINGQSSGSTIGANALNAACIDPSWGGFFNQDNLFNYGMGSFRSMDACYSYIVSQLTPYCTNDQNAGIVFQKMKMGLIRCFRKILRQQMAFTQWMPEQQQSFNYTDNSLYALLAIFAQSNGNTNTQLGW